jgi:5-methylcytosine-specific restriction protein A
MPTRPPSIGQRPNAAPQARAKDRRPSSNARGYGARWQKAAALHLAQHPLCVRCNGLASLVDHIRPVQGEDDAGFFDADNHQSLCRRCHAVKTGQDKRAGLTRRF